MADVTFRDFAAAIMKGDDPAARDVLVTLLRLSPDSATAAAAYFRAQMKDPSFMGKAMGLRAAVETRDDAQIGALLTDCFGLAGDERVAAVAALQK